MPHTSEIDLLQQSARIRQEAASILFEDGLMGILQQHGTIHCTGSYQLDLMMKKDLDLTLINPCLTPAEFNRLGCDLADHLYPHSMQYRNTRIKPIANRPPDSLYWGLGFRDWNMDLWLVPEEYYQESVAYLDGISSILDEPMRRIILRIKKEAIDTGVYGNQFTSRELYHGVIHDNVRDLRDLLKRLPLKVMGGVQ